MEKPHPISTEHIANGHILTIKLEDGDHKFFIPYCNDKEVTDNVKILITDIRSAMDGSKSLLDEDTRGRQKELQNILQQECEIDCCGYCLYLATVTMRKDIIPVMCWNPIGGYATLYSRSWSDKSTKQLRIPMALNGDLYKWLDVLENKY